MSDVVSFVHMADGTKEDYLLLDRLQEPCLSLDLGRARDRKAILQIPLAPAPIGVNP